MEYNHREIEKKWQIRWHNHQVYKVSEDQNKPKYYVLDMFPYPSGAGLHVGHPLGYIASDIFSRFKRHKGYNVLHPMGYDAFGLPAEQYAIQTGVHPAVSTAKNIEGFRKQMDNIGFSYDWDREVNTSEPKYYKWTQWIFKQLFEHYYDLNTNKALPIAGLINAFEKGGSLNVSAANHLDKHFTAEEWKTASRKQQSDWLMCFRLAYRKEGFVNWCEALGTVLANDEIKDGVSERGGHPVSKKSMNQWFLRTTAYASRLLEGLENVDWPESLKIMQRNWIGKSEGARVFFPLEASKEKIEVFTTRPDTIFGVTFMVLAPEHELVNHITTDACRKEVEQYIKFVESRSERDRLSEVRKLSGAFTGAYAVHPFTGEKIPVWISEYVLKDYGTGAIMAVPADDLRDQAFATHFGLPIAEVVDRSAFPEAETQDKVGSMINSDFLNGLQVKEAISRAIEVLEERKMGERKINFKLRDANYSRQRYWGEPFPIVYDQDGVALAISDDELPLELPELDDFKPGADGKAPLAKAGSWVQTSDGYKREIDTMPGFAGSSWYFLRYMDPFNTAEFCSAEKLHYWKEVDLYIGGAEHAVGHLLYARTWHKFLYDIGLVPTQEPFKKLINQGMIQGLSAFIYSSKTPVSSYYHPIKNQWLEVKLDTESQLFISKELVENYPDKSTEFIRIHIPIEFVSDHGKQAYINGSALIELASGRPEFKHRILISADGTGNTNEANNMSDLRIYLDNEVEKMSKSKYNVVNPDIVIDEYGADCFRMYEMFLGPIEQSKPWDTNGIDGVAKFLRRFWSLYHDSNDGNFHWSEASAEKQELKVLHTLIKKVNEDLDNFSFNTCVSAFMIAVNELKKLNCNKREILEPMIILLSPSAPHMSCELWEKAGKKTVLNDELFPNFEAKYLESDVISYPVCVNGKKKSLLELESGLQATEIEKIVRNHEHAARWTDGKEIRKVIVVPGKMINMVV